jgi:hypothetical protein
MASSSVDFCRKTRTVPLGPPLPESPPFTFNLSQQYSVRKLPTTFSVATQFAVSTDKSEHPRGMPLVTRMEELQANMCGIQWHPRVQICRKKRAPHQQPRTNRCFEIAIIIIIVITFWIVARGYALVVVRQDATAPKPHPRIESDTGTRGGWLIGCMGAGSCGL